MWKRTIAIHSRYKQTQNIREQIEFLQRKDKDLCRQLVMARLHLWTILCICLIHNLTVGFLRNQKLASNSTNMVIWRLKLN